MGNNPYDNPPTTDWSEKNETKCNIETSQSADNYRGNSLQVASCFVNGTLKEGKSADGR